MTTTNSAPVISIDRSRPFNPAEFIGTGWKIDRKDARSSTLAEVDLTKIRFETCIRKGETWITGEEKLKRLNKSGHIRLDAEIFRTLWENQHLIPEHWKHETNGNSTYIFFDETILRNRHEDRSVLCLFWDGAEWEWVCSWLGHGWDSNDPSAVLAG